ncbi:hypothetical protein PO124_20235 [Bacillus licheniformis]|nr:hypothetical protein [Bacillus licheniformis]
MFAAYGSSPPFFSSWEWGPAQPKAAAAHHSQDLFCSIWKGPAEKDYVKVNESSVYQMVLATDFSGRKRCVQKTQKRSAQKDYCIVNRTAFLADLSPANTA